MKKTQEPLKYFRDQYEAKKKAFGGAMLASAGPGPKKKKRSASAPKRKPTKTKWKSCFSGSC
jgi:hypothetical protein